MVEGGRFELPNPKERIYSPPRLATSLPLRYKWCRQEDLNPQPTDYKSVALPIELHRRAISDLNSRWWRMTGSNRRPPACKAGALPAELILRYISLATSYSHRDKVPTTIGAKELNFRVRYGNGCDLFAIATRHIILYMISKRKQDFFEKFCSLKTR